MSHMRGGVPRFHHPLRDRPPEASQGDRLLLLRGLGNNNSSSSSSCRSRSGDRNHSSRHSLRSSFLRCRPHVLIGHPPLRAASLQGGDIDVEFPGETASGGSSQDSRGRGLGKTRRWWCPRLSTRRLLRGRGGERSERLLSVLRDDENRLPDLHSLALLGQDPGDHATAWGGNLNVDLVRHYFDERLVFLHVLPLPDKPLQNLAFGDSLTDVWKFEFVRQDRWPLFSPRPPPLVSFAVFRRLDVRLVVENFSRGLQYSILAGNVLVLKLGERNDCVETSDSLHRRLQVVEALVYDLGGDLGAYPESPRRLVDYHHSPRLPYGCEYGLEVDWR